MKIGALTFKYAVRNLTRHTRRTVISMIGVGIGCAMVLIARSWMGGAMEMQVRAIAESGSGYLMVVPREWPETRENNLRLARWRDTLDKVKALPGLEACTARAKANGLLAFGNRTAGAQITAVDPQEEYAFNRIVRRADLEGRYLEAEDTGAVVIGSALAKRLDVELDDDLYATLPGRDDIHSAMLRIVGILDTGSRDLDLSICHISLTTLETITGIEGAAEISILLKNQHLISDAQRALNAEMPEDNVVITWKEVHRGLAAGMDGDKAFMRLMSAIIILVVGLGIASAQLTAVLERRMEFAVLSALGMRGSQIIIMILIESFIIGVGGAVVALIAGGAGAWYLTNQGVDMRFFLGEDLGFSDILLDPYIYGSFGPWLVGYALSISIAATVLATLYPAWKATRITPAEALRT